MSSIKTFREAMGMRQEEFAKIINVSTVNYSKKENGAVKFSLNEARLIAEHFDRPIEAVFFAHEVSKNESLSKV